MVAGLLKRDDGILRRVLRSIGRVEPPLQLQNLGSQLATVRLLLATVRLLLATVRSANRVKRMPRGGDADPCL